MGESTVHFPARAPQKFRAYCLLLTRGSRGGSLALGRDGRGELGGGRGGRSRVWSAAVLGVPRDGQVRQDRPRDADLIRHHKTCRRKTQLDGWIYSTLPSVLSLVVLLCRKTKKFQKKIFQPWGPGDT